MLFHLNYNPPESTFKIQHRHQVLMIGSCFSEHISSRLSDLKFDVQSNPFGIVFNPQSIAMMLKRCLHQNYFSEKEVFEKDGRWFCLEASTLCFGSTREELLDKLNQQVDEWHMALKTAEVLIITFGSAYAYQHLSENKIVTNCHKLPSRLFEKKLLPVSLIVTVFSEITDELRQLNPHIQIIYTVSPVKHLKDGVEENVLSKAFLIASVYELASASGSGYFPAYELINEDLRDYRFYEADMAHPNEQAIQYVWDKFVQCYFLNETRLLNLQIEDIHKAMQHNPFNAESQAHVQFKHNYLDKCKSLLLQHSWLNLSKEINYFSG